MPTLPDPRPASPAEVTVLDSVEALAISARLTTLIHDEIDRSGGWIPFSRFMALALYAPGLGYYSAGAAKIGRDASDGSDFVTAPELTPLFGRALARTVADALSAGGNTVLELGGGTGRLAVDLLGELEALDALPERYQLLEVSADLRDRQRDTIVAAIPHLAPRVHWLEALPDRIDGVVVGNEVLDALPVELHLRSGEAWKRRGVSRSGHSLRFAERAQRGDQPRPGVAPDGNAWPDGYITETHPAATALVTTIAARMTPSATALFVDYGFPAGEYYHPQRSAGTLMAHRRHRSSTDVLAMPGLQDITAHVDFSAVAQAAAAVSVDVVGYTSQAAFLIDCGIVDLMAGDAGDVRGWAPQAAALQTLLSEAEMGELFKVIALSRVGRPLRGFGRSDRSASLVSYRFDDR